MIRVQKPAAPAMLLDNTRPTRGPQLIAELKRRYDAGERSFTFRSDTYGHTSVKQALIKAQHHKCAFCEQLVTLVSHGDVEHYRPKAGWDQGDGAKVQKPGYYWLAYDWDNLLLSCEICNQSFKGNRFPLADPAKRARSHHDDLAAEDPLLIHPSHDDPEALIGWRGGVPHAIDENRRGRATIKLVGLDRPDVVAARNTHLARLRTIQQVLNGAAEAEHRGEPPTGQLRVAIAALTEELANAVRPDAVYSAMVRANL